MIRIEQAVEGVVLITLDDGKVNVLDLGVLDELTAAFREQAGQAVVVTGAGRAFCAGVDLTPVVEGGRSYVERFLPALDRMFLAVFDHPRPVVAAVNGHALAGGCVLALAADRRLMSGGTIGVTELAVGVPFPPSAYETVRMAAGHRTPDLMLAARRLDPEEALSVGLVDELVAPVELLEQAVADAERLAVVPAETFAFTKRQLRGEVRARIERDGAAQLPGLVDLWSGEPVQAAIRGYLASLARR
jgi:enoyl-CoA hydratase